MKNKIKTQHNNLWAIMPDYFYDFQKNISNIQIDDIEDYKIDNETNYVVEDGWAIIEINGVLIYQPSILEIILGAINTADLLSLFASAIEANDNKGVLLKFNSPGGEVTGIEEFANFIFDTAQRTTKPIVSYIDGMAASGAFWLAEQADKVYALPSSIVGSIGVITVLTDTTRAEKNMGYDSYYLKTGDNKAVGVGQISEKQLEIYKQIQNNIFSKFVSAIERARKIKLSDEEKDGRIFTAEQVKNKFVDEVGLLNILNSEFKF